MEMPAAPSLAPAPIVYLGATLSRAEAAAIVPRCQFEGPIARGDLYRHRNEGASVFVIIDGLFHQRHAVSPREVVDVVRDGAVVFGASSMGALRAADCWPAGVRGVGLIYRLLRMGVLDSDDEVAVQIAGGEAVTGSASIALVNVRYAASKARRARVITRPQADALVRAAASHFYADRRWPVIFREAGLANLPREALDFVTSRDLKKQDALAAMAALRRFLERGHLPSSTPRTGASSLSAPVREAVFDVFSGTTAGALMPLVFEWMVGTGRCVRYLAPLLLSLSAEDGDGPPRSGLARAAREARAYLTKPLTPVALTQALVVLLDEPESLADELWAQLDASGTLEAEVMRTRCAHAASEAAQARGLLPRPQDWGLAQFEITSNFAFEEWDFFSQSVLYPRLERWVRPAVEILARAKRVRAACASGELLFDE
jgi:hypothetical protein